MPRAEGTPPTEDLAEFARLATGPFFEGVDEDASGSSSSREDKGKQRAVEMTDVPMPVSGRKRRRPAMDPFAGK